MNNWENDLLDRFETLNLMFAELLSQLESGNIGENCEHLSAILTPMINQNTRLIERLQREEASICDRE